MLAHYDEGLYTWGEVVAGAVAILAADPDPVSLLVRLRPQLRNDLVAHLESVDPDACAVLGPDEPRTRSDLRRLRLVLGEAGVLDLDVATPNPVDP